MPARLGLFVLLAGTLSGCTTNGPTPIPSHEEEHAAGLPVLRVVQTSTPPRLDGDLSDGAWRLAATTGPFVDTRSGGPARVSATAKALWDPLYLYVGVHVADRWLVGPDTRQDSHLWEQDCVELMIRRPGERGYFEIQVSPRGIVFDTRYDDRRVPAPFGHTAWKSEVRAAVSTQGEIDDRRSDAGYTVEIAIPWQAFSPAESETRLPVVGGEWRANFFVLDRTQNGQQASSWSPPRTGDFHVPSRFGTLRFAQPGKSRQQRLESEEAPH
ncbi:MAG: carbohydrate-binding family 9-like protein [Polyangiales bacterium]